MGYNIIADLHTHTLASTHAYSTFSEMVRAAADRGLYALAVTDHAKTMPGSPRDWYFGCLCELPLYYRGVMTIGGIEANVLDFEGTLDVEERDVPKLNWIVASIHNLGLEGLRDPDVEKCTHLWLQVAKDPRVNVIAHSGDPNFVYDYDRVIQEFGANHKLVEINNNSFHVRRDAVINCREIALLCKKHGVRVIVNTDSHFATQVGHAGLALKMLDEIGFPEELVVNSSVERFRQYLKERNIHLED